MDDLKLIKLASDSVKRDIRVPVPDLSPGFSQLTLPEQVMELRDKIVFTLEKIYTKVPIVLLQYQIIRMYARITIDNSAMMGDLKLITNVTKCLANCVEWTTQEGRKIRNDAIIYCKALKQKSEELHKMQEN